MYCIREYYDVKVAYCVCENKYKKNFDVFTLEKQTYDFIKCM